MTITVFCASSTRIDPKHVEVAAALGTELARRGHVLVTGGGTKSCMGAVARAARAAGGRTVGVVPAGMPDSQEGADTENDELVRTPDMRSRKAEMDRRADGFLILPGGIGTLEELFEVWTARVLAMHEKPVVILDPTGVYEPLRDLMQRLTEQGFARHRIWDAIGWTSTVAEAFDLLERSQPRIEFSAGDYAETQL